ncbi:MAG: hypothetical protein E5W56_05800 [Mesorhizobium sp.]|nr:MAG: hypothetical protein E5W56_05800 [Mesorhizobium sp.]
MLCKVRFWRLCDVRWHPKVAGSIALSAAVDNQNNRECAHAADIAFQKRSDKDVDAAGRG